MDRPGAVIVPVCIFAKPPVPGKVKTRLMPVLGAAGAAALAHAMLQDTWQTVEDCAGVRPVLATTEPGAFGLRCASPEIWLQGEGDLGSRIQRIVLRGLSEASAVIALGADSPAVSTAHLRTAVDSLQKADAVVGPSLDGGFYLLALRRCPSALFEAIPWSSSGTLHALRARMDAAGFSVSDLPPLFDVDTRDDLTLLGTFLRDNPSAAPVTRACLRARCESA